MTGIIIFTVRFVKNRTMTFKIGIKFCAKRYKNKTIRLSYNNIMKYDFKISACGKKLEISY